MDADEQVRAVIWVHGRVQGVGFRWWARSRALELGLVGHARNASGGRVEVVAQGEAASVRELVALLKEQPSRHHRPGDVTACVDSVGPPRAGLSGFVEK